VQLLGKVTSEIVSLVALPLCLLFSSSVFALDTSEPDYKLKLLGKYVFFDKISVPQRMACVSCHDPETGGTGSVSGVNLHQVVITGANPHTAGNLKPPTNAYASFLQPFQPCSHGGLGRNNFCGGNFWDGRAEGNAHPEDGGPGALFPSGATKHIGNEVFQNSSAPATYANYFGPTSDQALNPMPNTVEQNVERQAVCQHVAAAKYAELYRQAWGVNINCSSVPVATSASDATSAEKEYDISFKRLMLAVGAWQHSSELNSFSSRRDIALRAELACLSGAPNADPAVCADPKYTGSPGEFPLVGLTDQENYGHDLFYATRFAPMTVETADGPVNKFSNCAFCHADNPVLPGPGPKDNGAELHQLYTAQDYHNIGTPANPELPSLGPGLQPAPALGISDHTGLDAPGLHGPGFFKTPTLRNVDKRKGKGFIKAYAHNGWFKSMESIVHFYNTAFLGNCVVDPGTGEDCTGRGEVPYSATTAAKFGITRCAGVVTEKDALAKNCWPAPEFDRGAIPFLVGDLGLTSADEAAIVAYLKTLTDTEKVKAPAPYK